MLAKSVPARQPTTSVFVYCRKGKKCSKKRHEKRKINDESQFSYLINSLLYKSIREIIRWKSILQANTTFTSVGYISVHDVFVECTAQLWASSGPRLHCHWCTPTTEQLQHHQFRSSNAQLTIKGRTIRLVFATTTRISINSWLKG